MLLKSVFNLVVFSIFHLEDNNGVERWRGGNCFVHICMCFASCQLVLTLLLFCICYVQLCLVRLRWCAGLSARENKSFENSPILPESGLIS
jgi:hypothetical protein